MTNSTSERRKVIADNIHKYLALNNMSQVDLAVSVGISKSTLSDYLNLRSAPSYKIIQKIADTFHVNNYEIDTTFSGNSVQAIISNNLYTLMTSNSETLTSLSNSLHLPYATVSDWIHGKKVPRSNSLELLSMHYGVSVSFLMSDNASNNINIPVQIKHYREKFNMTQDQLAEKLTVSKQTISNWETGIKTPRMDKLLAISNLFKIIIGDIVDGPSSSEGTKVSNNTKIIEKLITENITNDQLDSIFSFIDFTLHKNNS